jgi:hypothetical protein
LAPTIDGVIDESWAKASKLEITPTVPEPFYLLQILVLLKRHWHHIHFHYWLEFLAYGIIAAVWVVIIYLVLLIKKIVKLGLE